MDINGNNRITACNFAAINPLKPTAPVPNTTMLVPELEQVNLRQYRSQSLSRNRMVLNNVNQFLCLLSPHFSHQPLHMYQMTIDQKL